MHQTWPSDYGGHFPNHLISDIAWDYREMLGPNVEYKNLPWMWGVDRKILSRVTVWHYEAMPSYAKQWFRGTYFSVCIKQPWYDSFSGIPFDFQHWILTLESPLTSHVPIRWRHNDVNFQRRNGSYVASYTSNVLTSHFVNLFLSTRVCKMDLSALVKIAENLVWYARKPSSACW